MRTILLSALLGAMALAPAHAQTRQLGAGALSAGSGSEGRKIVTHCGGASFCNIFIASCIANGGTFGADEHDGQGRPIKGHCVR